MNDVESRAREYLAEHSEYSEVFGQTFVAVDTLTAMVEFAEQENAKLKEQHKTDLVQMQAILNQRSIQNVKLTKAKELLQKCLNTYLRDPQLRSKVEEFLKELEK